MLCQAWGHFSLLLEIASLVGLLTAWVVGLLGSQTPPPHGNPQGRGLHKVAFANFLLSSPLLITIWKEKKSWEWGLKGRLEMTNSNSFSVRMKRGPEKGYVPCPGHRTSCALIHDPAFILFHTSSPVKDFRRREDCFCFNRGAL